MYLSTFTKKFIKEGFCIEKLISSKDINYFRKIIFYKINKILRKKLFLSHKDLKKFHQKKISPLDEEKIVNFADRFILPNKNFLKKLEKNKIINQIAKDTWGHNDFSIYWVGSIKKKKFKKGGINYRIAKPGKKNVKKVAGIHCDINVGGEICYDKDVLITAWVPIFGFSKKYTLKIYPKSHLFTHKKNFYEKKSKKISKIFKSSYYKKFSSFRPNLSIGDAIIFHPNLLHGASYNLGNDTRFSLEIRFYNNKNKILWERKI